MELSGRSDVVDGRQAEVVRRRGGRAGAGERLLQQAHVAIGGAGRFGRRCHSNDRQCKRRNHQQQVQLESLDKQ